MTIRTSLTIAAVISITFAGVTQSSFSSPVTSSAAIQLQGVGVTAAAATPQDVDRVPLDPLEMCPVDAAKSCPTGQARCGAGCYDPRVSCCCTPTKKDHEIVPKRRANNCIDACRAAAMAGRGK